jgi:acyl carrier protein
MINNNNIGNFILSELSKGTLGNSLDENQDLISSGVIDSLGIMKLIEYIEREYAIAVSDEEILPENFESLKAITRFIKSKQN